jgi:hypothetical protein
LLRGDEWGTLAEREIRPLVRASLVNRWLFERLPPRGEAAVIAYFARYPNLHALVGRWYQPRRLHHLLWPLVAWHYRRQIAS